MKKIILASMLAFAALSMSAQSSPEGNHPYAIDLGLPSGTKWADRNVGASSPTDFGSYFAWGETATKSSYAEENYKLGQLRHMAPGWDALSFSKYSDNDGKTLLELSDDAAQVNWGGLWRLPTKEECEELVDKCRKEWTTMNGINGWKFTGPNGQSIFLPAAGIRDGLLLNFAGSGSTYWSSSLENQWWAYCLGFESDIVVVITHHREIGHCVRPVCK